MKTDMISAYIDTNGPSVYIHGKREGPFVKAKNNEAMFLFIIFV